MRTIWIALLMLGLAAPGAAAPAGEDTSLAWMVGDWRSDVGGVWTTEHWQPVKHGTMRGTSASGRDGKASEQESMQIGLKKRTAVFTAKLPGQPPVDFVEIYRGGQEIAFANDAHDYPQRIRYWREGDKLLAEIALHDGSKAMRWTYRRR